MMGEPGPVDVYLEVGSGRVFAVVPAWPGWCRGGRGEEDALRALAACASRYARVVATIPPAFFAPAGLEDLRVLDRLPGTTTTDFGAPDLALPGDDLPLAAEELERLQAILSACWAAFDRAAQAAAGQTLRSGPRGGGRDLAKMAAHTRDAEAAYVSSLGGRWKPAPGQPDDQAWEDLRQAALDTLARSARGEIPARGPRGGLRWTPRYFTRRAAWHILDHAWEIEDRIA